MFYFIFEMSKTKYQNNIKYKSIHDMCFNRNFKIDMSMCRVCSTYHVFTNKSLSNLCLFLNNITLFVHSKRF